MKSRMFVPLITYPDANSAAIASNAAAVAAHLGADLHALALLADIPPVSNPLGNLLLDIPELTRKAESTSRENGAALSAQVEAEAEKRSVRLATETKFAQVGTWGDAAAAQARYADCAVVGWDAGNAISHMVAEAVIFGSGRPTLVLPAQVQFHRTTHIAIAWDGSRVAARAAFDAINVLPEVSKVSVLTVTDEKPLAEADPASRLAEVLRARGLEAEPITLAAEDCPIAETLQEQAIARGADLLVMGGYGHSRLRDFVLGGATQGVLQDLRLPVMLSH